MLYNRCYCQEMIDFFDLKPYEVIHTAQGRKEIPVDVPFKREFAHKIGVNIDTLYAWGDKHPEFKEAFKYASFLQEKILRTNALRGLYSAAFAIFTAKNILRWRDSHDLNHKGNMTFDFYKKVISECGNK